MTVTTLKPKVESFIDATKAVTDTDTNMLAIKEELARQSGLIYYYSSKYAEAVRQAARMKMQLEIKEAQAAQDIRQDAMDKGEKLTVDQVKQLVRLNKEVCAIEVAKIDADAVEETLKGIVVAIRDKSQNLTTITHLERDQIRARLMHADDMAPEENSDLHSRGKALKERLAK